MNDRVAYLCDRLELDDLVTGYANSLDDRDWPRLRDLFTPDATLDFTGAYGIVAERDPFVAWLEGQVTREFAPEIQHLFTNRACRIDGDTASGGFDSYNPDIIDEGNGSRYVLMNGGRYTFEARRTGDGWRFSRFAATVLWSHRAELLLFELPES
ncbi:MAG: nuclear transport factor 2 family protein [Actinobacteria bacterium]|nr:nuclear transport factor 2 family protein [Actinomycetota bacterium]